MSDGMVISEEKTTEENVVCKTGIDELDLQLNSGIPVVIQCLWLVAAAQAKPQCACNF